ncbi:hypothetical protein V5030_12735 [Moellerella wisconsensis]|uniref:hypothetical protein n=1 Tax=Moellerella wisconsensis TaxID=158849 RepID=UPI0030765F27
MINSELPKVDVTYGTNRYGYRGYNHIGKVLLASSKTTSAKVTMDDGSTFNTNVKKVSSSKNLIIFSDRRERLSNISVIELIDKIHTIESDSILKRKEVNQISPLLTFHLILKKAYSVKKNVSVFMKSGCIYKGFSEGHDHDSLSIKNANGEITLIMYDAVKRIVPLEDDGTLAE